MILEYGILMLTQYLVLVTGKMLVKYFEYVFFLKRKSLVNCTCLVNHLNSMCWYCSFSSLFFGDFFNNFIQGEYLILKVGQLNYLMLYCLSLVSLSRRFLLSVIQFVVLLIVCYFDILELYVHFVNVLQKLTIFRGKRKLDSYTRSFLIL